VTSSASGINTVLSTPPLSTKTVRGRPPMSAHIRGRCHAISQSPRHPYISERPRTVHTRFPKGKLSRESFGIAMHRPLDPDTIAVPNTGDDGRPAPTSRKPLTTGDHWLWWLPNLWSSQADGLSGTTGICSSASNHRRFRRASQRSAYETACVGRCSDGPGKAGDLDPESLDRSARV
jgi:hypothetical protein